MANCLTLKKSNCKNCYKCIRHCPVKSIRFSGNQAHIIGNECILCGQCFVVCPQNAKQIVDETEIVKVILQGKEPVIVSLAPSFVANYDGVGIEAMREAISKLAVEPGILLNDAVTIPEMIIPQVPIIKGDAKSVSIAAASILAKVTRDRLMVEYDKVMPEYGFAGHKGYGSKEHIEAIKKYGPTPIHRRTFIKKFI